MPARDAGARSRHRLLVIVAVDYDSAVRKGVEHLLRQYDEQGFFERVILVSPYLRHDARITLDARHELRQFGLGRGLLQRLLAPLHLLRLIAACVRLVRRERVALIRATEPTLCGLVAWATAQLARVPYVVSLHAEYDKLFALDGTRGAPALFGSRALVRPLERLTLRGAARVLPIRESLVRFALARGVRRDRVCVIPHGIDLVPFEVPAAVDIRAQLGIPAGLPIVAFAGRLSPENYVADMLDAVRRVAARRRDFVFVLAGGGVLEAAVAAQIAGDPVLAAVVRTPGFVPQETVVVLRRAAAVSLCLMGGFSLIEACAAGRPVIAYDVDWHRELIIDGPTGRLIPERDVAAVADAMEFFFDHPDDAARMGAAAKALAFERHSLDTATATRRRCYEQILGA